MMLGVMVVPVVARMARAVLCLSDGDGNLAARRCEPARMPTRSLARIMLTSILSCSTYQGSRQRQRTWLNDGVKRTPLLRQASDVMIAVKIVRRIRATAHTPRTSP